jgi:5-methylcytosine-specific restriction protein A
MTSLCSIPFCPNLVESPGRCPDHGSTSWDAWRQTDEGKRKSRGYGSAWRRVRDAYLRSHPLCEECGQPAHEVNHRDGRSPLEPGANAESNLQALCRRCHRRAPALRRRVVAGVDTFVSFGRGAPCR